MGYVHVQLKEATASKTFEQNYPYWRHVWTYFTDDYETVTVQCWREETTVIDELKRMTNRIHAEGLIIEITLLLNDKTRAYFTERAAGDYKLKWFNVFLYDRHNREGIEFHDYGKEISFNHVTAGDAEDLLAFFEGVDADVRFVPDED